MLDGDGKNPLRAVRSAAITLYWKAGRNAVTALATAEVICAKKPEDSESRKRWLQVVELLVITRDTGQMPLNSLAHG